MTLTSNIHSIVESPLIPREWGSILHTFPELPPFETKLPMSLWYGGLSSDITATVPLAGRKSFHALPRGAGPEPPFKFRAQLLTQGGKI